MINKLPSSNMIRLIGSFKIQCGGHDSGWRIVGVGIASYYYSIAINMPTWSTYSPENTHIFQGFESEKSERCILWL